MSGADAAKREGAKSPGEGARIGPLLGFTLAALGAWLLVFAMPPDPGESHFALQADAFLRGELFVDVSGERSPVDYTRHVGRYSIPWGPAPALLLLPGVLVFGPDFPQSLLALALNVANLLLCVALARRLGYGAREGWLAGLALVAASPYLATATALFSSWLTHLAGTAFVLAALVEWAGRRRWLLVGIAVGLAGLSRPTLFVSGAFLLGALAHSRPGWRAGLRSAALLAAPVVLCAALFAAFNHARFGDVAETGYRHQLLPAQYARERSEGLFSPRHALHFFGDLLLAVPQRRGEGDPRTAPGGRHNPEMVRWRTSLLLTSPWLLTLLGLARRQPLALWAVAGALLVALPSSLWFHRGDLEYGNRFAVDFLPLLLLAVLLRHGGALPPLLRGVILVAAWGNLALCTWYVFDRFG